MLAISSSAFGSLCLEIGFLRYFAYYFILLFIFLFLVLCFYEDLTFKNDFLGSAEPRVLGLVHCRRALPLGLCPQATGLWMLREAKGVGVTGGCECPLL